MTVNEALKQILKDRKDLTQDTLAERISERTGVKRDQRYVSTTLMSKNMTIKNIELLADLLDYEVVLRPKTGKTKKGEYII